MSPPGRAFDFWYETLQAPFSCDTSISDIQEGPSLSLSHWSTRPVMRNIPLIVSVAETVDCLLRSITEPILTDDMPRSGDQGRPEVQDLSPAEWGVGRG